MELRTLSSSSTVTLRVHCSINDTLNLSTFYRYIHVLQFVVDLLQGTVTIPCAESQSYMNLSGENHFDNRPEAISMDCEMVGGGTDGSLDLCARVCLTDEDENILFHTYVRPQISITNYR